MFSQLGLLRTKKKHFFKNVKILKIFRPWSENFRNFDVFEKMRLKARNLIYTSFNYNGKSYKIRVKF